jgi:hypothetical protein
MAQDKKRKSARGCGASADGNNKADTGGQGALIEKRRKLLGGMVATGALGGASLGSAWKKPVVETVMLPAHAQTTTEPPDSGGCNATCSMQITQADLAGGDINVLGLAAITACCWTPDVGYEEVIAILISDGVTLTTDTMGLQDCSATVTAGVDPALSGCVLSATAIETNTFGLNPGDSITLRLTYGGACICSDVATLVDA